MLFGRSGDQKLEWLASLPWWKELDRRDLVDLAATGDRLTLPAGQTFIREAALGTQAAVIASGVAEVVKNGEVIAQIGPGDVVGELSLLGDHPRRNADVRTVTDVELLIFSVRSFERVMQVEPVRRQIEEAASAHANAPN